MKTFKTSCRVYNTMTNQLQVTSTHCNSCCRLAVDKITSDKVLLGKVAFIHVTWLLCIQIINFDMTKPKYDKSSIKSPAPPHISPPLSNKPQFRERKLISPRPFFRGLTVLRNATKFVIKALLVVKMEFYLTCLSNIIKTVQRSLPICNRLWQIHFANIEKNLGGGNRNKGY